MIVREIRKAILEAIEGIEEIRESLADMPETEKPRSKDHGDISSNIALILSAKTGQKPVDIAKKIASALREDKRFQRIEVAGPGFINITYSNELIYKEIARAYEEAERYGYSSDFSGKSMQIEFVSANPVGPLHVGAGRWAALGDSLASILEMTGYKVEREYYVNDYGNQIKLFAESVDSRLLEINGVESEFPKEGYLGDYIYETARSILESKGDGLLRISPEERKREIQKAALEIMVSDIRETLESFGVFYDRWYSESSLYESGKVDRTVEELKKKGLAYEHEGALWFRSTDFGDEKDRVLIKSNGEATYFLPDIAYHLEKFERGFDHIIDIWGTDHHGYVPRMRAAMKAYGHDEDFEVVLGQLVSLNRHGEPVRMSKRSGEIVTFKSLIEEVGRDPARYLLLKRSADAHLDFDIELAKEQKMENPVYYVQYAHARICQILSFARESGVKIPEIKPSLEILRNLKEAAEIELCKKIMEFEEIIFEAATRRAPHKLTWYCEELCASFHFFYKHHRVIGVEQNLCTARLYLCLCVRQVLKNCFKIIGISAPEKM